MAKMYKKDKLQYKNGFIVKGDKVVGVDNTIVAALNRFERAYQKFLWNENIEKPKPVEDKPFMFETEHGNIYPKVTPDTPLLDIKALETMTIMDELDEIKAAEKINEVFNDNLDLFAWLDSEYIISCKHQQQLQFDLRYLGNPLKLTKDRLCEIIIEMNS